MMRRILIFLFLLFSPGLLWATWTKTGTITIDHDQCGVADSAAFAVYVGLSDSSLKTTGNGGAMTSLSGYDIYFYSDAARTTRIPAQRISYSATGGTWTGWVKRDISASVNTLIYVGWGDAVINTDPNLDGTYGTAAVYDASTVGAYHFEDSATPALDATSNDNDLTQSGGVTFSATGRIGSAITLDGTDDKLTKTSMAGFDGTSSMTYMAWVKLSSGYSGYPEITSLGTVVKFYVDGDTNKSRYTPNNGANAPLATAAITLDTWQHVTLVATDAGDVTFYMNGSANGTTASVPVPEAQTSITVGKISYGWYGTLDEIVVAKTARTASWVTAYYNNTKEESTFLSFTVDVGSVTQVRSSLLLMGLGGALVQQGEPPIELCVGPFSLISQEDYTCRPYPASMWNTPLPSDVITHKMANSDTIATEMLTWNGWNSLADNLYGYMSMGKPDQFNGADPMYYGNAGDPVWKITACYMGWCQASLINSYWRIPEGAAWSHACDEVETCDSRIQIWDQVGNKILAMYVPYEGTTRSFTGCTGYTELTACEYADVPYAHWQPYNQTGASTYQQPYFGYDSMGAPPNSLDIRHQELIQGEIKHALALGVACIDGDKGFLFPFNSSGGLKGCDELETENPGIEYNLPNRPGMGNLFFLDYTDSQITAMSIPGWQKIILRALSRYGGYINVTYAAGAYGIEITKYESVQPYHEAAISPIPVMTYLDAQVDGTVLTGNSAGYAFHIFQNIPLVTGPNCTETPCGIVSHAHFADECVAKQLAGTGSCD